MAPDLAVLVRLGVSLMLIAQMALIAPMALRIWLTHQDGLAHAGLFQAAWTISAQIMAVLLTGVGVDFYPRLSAMTGNRDASADVLDRQIRLHLAVGGPVLLLTAGLAPAMLTVLYSDGFAPAAPLLQGLVLGNLARLISAPLETVLTAAGRPREVLAIGGVTLVVLLAGSVAGSAHWGMTGIGVAFAVAQFAHLAILGVATARRTGVAPTPGTVIWMAGLALAALALALAGTPASVALLAAVLASIPGLRRIRSRRPWRRPDSGLRGVDAGPSASSG